MDVTSSAVIIPHPAPEIDLTTDEAVPTPAAEVSPPAAVPAPAATPAVVKQEAAAAPPPPVVRRTATTEATPAANQRLDPDIYCGIPPIPAGWCQPDLCGPAPPLPAAPPPSPEPLISISELASALGIALVSGMALGGTLAFLLRRPTTLSKVKSVQTAA